MAIYTDSNSSDFMNVSIVLRNHGSNRTKFNPKNKEHLESMKTFVETGNWGKIQFYCEHPYTDVPTTVLMKFAAEKLKADVGTRISKLDETVTNRIN